MKKIRFSCHNINNECENGFSIVERDYVDETTWKEIVHQFNEFLASCGYVVKKYNTFVEAAGDNNICGT